MKKETKRSLKLTGIALLVILGFLYISNLIAWYGNKRSQYRTASNTIKESEGRGVFQKSLQFKIDRFSSPNVSFQPFLEKSFHYGFHSTNDTRPLLDSRYPYQLSFKTKISDSAWAFIRKDQLTKFDSSDEVWGYLSNLHLKDTIILEIRGSEDDRGIIKVWE